MASFNVIEQFLKQHREELGADGVLRVCVGGGAGFIGSHIAKRLKENVSDELLFLLHLFLTMIRFQGLLRCMR